MTDSARYIKIVEDNDFDSPSLPGTPLGLKAFKNWIVQAENAPTIDLQEAKTKWAAKRKELQKLAR